MIDDTIALRGRYFPNVKISVLSNATRLGSESVCRALARVDNNILKLDSAVTATMQAIDRPNSPAFTSEKAIADLCRFGGDCIIQTMFLRGEYEGVKIDNATPAEVDALIEAYRRIRPREIMIYSIDRKTPAEGLEKVSREELEAIGRRIVDATGIKIQVA